MSLNPDPNRLDEWSALFDALPVGAFRSVPGGRLVRANTALARMAGFSSGSELVAAVNDLSADLYVQPGRRRELLALLDREGSARGLVSEIRHQTPGKTFWISENAHVIRDADGRVVYYEGTAEDISDRVHAHRALERNVALLRDVTARIPGMVFRVHAMDDGTQHYDFVSEGVRALYGVEPEDLLADPYRLRRMQHPDDTAQVQAKLHAHLATLQPNTIEFRICLDGGDCKWVRLSWAVGSRTADGAVVHGYVTDISEARAAEQTLRDVEQLRRQRDRAQAADRAKSELMSRISHELRTPLNAVLGFSQLLEADGGLSERHRTWAGQILGSGRHLLSLVDDVLDLSSAHSGQLKVQMEAVDLQAAFADSWSLVEASARQAGIELKASPADALCVWADRKRLRQVLSNLLGNAIKYSRPAGGEIRYRAWTEGDEVVFEVADNGIGIAPDMIARAFTAFERLGAERSTVAGTGLGLALSRQLVEAMGGSIAVRSDLGQGSCFTVRLAAAG